MCVKVGEKTCMTSIIKIHLDYLMQLSAACSNTGRELPKGKLRKAVQQ